MFSVEFARSWIRILLLLFLIGLKLPAGDNQLVESGEIFSTSSCNHAAHAPFNPIDMYTHIYTHASHDVLKTYTPEN